MFLPIDYVPMEAKTQSAEDQRMGQVSGQIYPSKADHVNDKSKNAKHEHQCNQVLHKEQSTHDISPSGCLSISYNRTILIKVNVGTKPALLSL